MDRDEHESEVEAAYRHLSRIMHVRLADWNDLRKLVSDGYKLRAQLNAALADAEKTLGPTIEARQ